MSTLAVTNTFSTGTIADASQVNANFSDIVNYVNNRNSGSSTWDAISSSSATNVPLTCDNSSGSQNIAVFKNNGSNVLVIATGGVSTFTATGTNKNCVVVTGTGTGVGITATGGTTGGLGGVSVGILAAGGGGNAHAGYFTGTGTGAGVSATGGSTGGTGGASAGIIGVGGGGNSNGGYFTGTGSFAGVNCIGGSSNGAGINGNGTGTGPGGNFLGGSTGQGAFCQGGSGGGSTQALALVAGASSAHLNMLAVTATPTALANGDMWIENVSGTWHLKVRMNGATSTIV